VIRKQNFSIATFMILEVCMLPLFNRTFVVTMFMNKMIFCGYIQEQANSGNKIYVTFC